MDNSDAPRSRSPLRGWLAQELRQHTTVQPSDRPWEMPLAAALASGLPLAAGSALGRLDYGLVASLGGLAFMYLPATPLHHRMVSLLACAFAFTGCYALGLLSGFAPALKMPAVALIAILATMLCRFYRVVSPGSFFFVMVAAIGAYTPTTVEELPRRVGLLALGALMAVLVGFVYSLHLLRRRPAQPIEPLPEPTFDFVVFDSVVIGACVGISLGLAQLLQLEKAYWVPVGCLAVMQGATLRAVWNRQIQRVLGTSVGLLVAWALLSLPLEPWRICALVMALTFVIEAMVVRHYALAAVFITPLAILLAESANIATAHGGDAGTLIRARFLDTLLGCAVGFAGGVCLHSPRFRATASMPLRKLLNPRMP